MDNVLKILNETKEELLIKIKEVENDIYNWTEFLKTKNINSVSIEIKNNQFVIESEATKTLIEKVCEIIKANGREMFSNQIAIHLFSSYQDKKKDWVSRRISSVLSDDKNVSLVYGRKEKEIGQHHLAKVWGITEFKETDGNVKNEHKYKSTH